MHEANHNYKYLQSTVMMTPQSSCKFKAIVVEIILPCTDKLKDEGNIFGGCLLPLATGIRLNPRGNSLYLDPFQCLDGFSLH